jgi:hypothetical protein
MLVRAALLDQRQPETPNPIRTLESRDTRPEGHAVNNLGKRLAREREAERTLAGALRAVINGEEKGPLVAARRAKALRLELASTDSQLALEKSCREAGRPELTYELERIIERVINREPTARHTLVDTAKTLLSGLPDPRGRRFTIKTATHQLLLHVLERKKMPRAYTWNDREGECVDAAAKATRIAVGDPSFDPRYAYRDLVCVLCAVGRWLGRDARWFAASRLFIRWVQPGI